MTGRRKSPKRASRDDLPSESCHPQAGGGRLRRGEQAWTGRAGQGGQCGSRSPPQGVAAAALTARRREAGRARPQRSAAPAEGAARPLLAAASARCRHRQRRPPPCREPANGEGKCRSLLPCLPCRCAGSESHPSPRAVTPAAASPSREVPPARLCRGQVCNRPTRSSEHRSRSPGELLRMDWHIPCGKKRFVLAPLTCFVMEEIS